MPGNAFTEVVKNVVADVTANCQGRIQLPSADGSELSAGFKFPIRTAQAVGFVVGERSRRGPFCRAVARDLGSTLLIGVSDSLVGGVFNCDEATNDTPLLRLPRAQD